MTPKLPVICLAGPTGAGKTDLAICLARYFHGEIINADSRQLYADFPIISAQPDSSHMAQAPHHLYGVLPAQARMSAGEWSRQAAELCRQIHGRAHLPIIVGGTGFYFEALLRGLARMPEIPASISGKILAQMAEIGPEAMHRRLQAIDPVYAGKIHCHDRQRIMRALEVHEASGKNFSWWHGQGREAAPVAGPLLGINSTLAALEPRLALRIDVMLGQGALNEAAKAWEKCPDADAPAWSGIGCRQALAHWRGRIDITECKKQWLAATRAYAKRQLTWFRGRKNMVWLENGNSTEAIARAEQELAAPGYSI